jgi:phosphoribosylanthranilate isomerase
MEVKICGITHPKDAEHAAYAGADSIGIIFSSRSKRHVSLAQAMKIAQAARENGTEPVGIFVDETLAEILSICTSAKLQTIQLHGTRSQNHLFILLKTFSIAYAIPVNIDGAASPPLKLPGNVIPLFDCLHGGTGQTFNWENFSPPKKTPWVLAGGLCPDNVVWAIQLLFPHGVDVSSGVEFTNSTRKDPCLVLDFIQAAKQIETRSPNETP